ncbi:MAG: cyclic pyranopterin phosphate synthase MoaA, partial [Bacteroidetes bacterium]|nr:cyclic pyranopterin phosphate synthase MoaA [Bacteroidota bacterium]
KTCLYDDGVLNIKDLLRSGLSGDDLEKALLDAFGSRPADGREAEQKRNINDPAHESMATIGG